LLKHVLNFIPFNIKTIILESLDVFVTEFSHKSDWV